MRGLDRHIHTTDAEEHARLGFRRDCPRCRVRLTGTLPPAAVVPAPVKASLATGLVVVAGALPSASATADEPSPTTTAEIEPPDGAAAPDDTGGEPVNPPSGGDTDEVEAPATSAPSGDGGDDVVPLPSQSESDSGDSDSGVSDGGDSGPGDSAPAGESEAGEPQGDTSSGGEPRERDQREQDGEGGAAPSGGGAPTGLPEVGRASSDGPAGAEDRRGGDGKGVDRSSGAEGDEGGNDAPRRAQASKDKHVVERGDSLWAIARGSLGEDASDAKVAAKVARLWELNEDEIGTGDPNLIHPGQEIRLP